MNVVPMLNSLPTERPSAREQMDAPRDPAADAAPANSARQAPRNAPRAASARSARPTRESRDVRSGDDAVSSTDAADRKPVTKAEFSALLALLAGAGAQVRNDLVQQLPEEGVSLVDHLLQASTPESAAHVDNAANSAPLSSTAAGEAMRYGLLKLVPNAATDAAPHTGADLQTDANTASAIPEPPATKGSLDGLARAASRVSEQANDRSRALEAIARVAGQRGSSVEQLLALGDTRGAAAKQSLTTATSTAEELAKAKEQISSLNAEVEKLKAEAKSAERVAAERYGAASPKPLPVTPRGDAKAAELIARFKSITEPAAQTAFWRGLSAEQRALILNAQ